jgi:subtilisin-like proprotein convertase family protein
MRRWPRNPRSKSTPWICRLEPLEARALFSVSPGIETPLGWDGGTSSESAEYQLGFDSDPYAVKDTSSAPLGDATPTGTSYLLYEHWGGAWCDAEKTPSNTEDDLLCWAATASNILAWTGWGNVNGMANTDQIFAYFQNHWTDEGGMMQYGWDWWFDGTNPSQGWSGWSQVDVAGGGFYPSESFNTYFHAEYNEAAAMTAVSSYLQSGYGVGLGIYGPGGHAITCWGYNYDPSNPTNYLGVWVTDSDDSKYLSSPPDQLHYYEVANSGGMWYLQDYYGSDAWYIGAVQGLAPKTSTPTTPPEANEIRGTVWQDTNADGQHQAGENGFASQTVYLDANNNGQLDAGTSVVTVSTPKAIPDAGAAAVSTVNVTGAGRITDLNLTLNITHTWDSDLVAYLISPNGTRVTLFNGAGSSGDNFTNTILDDEATTSIYSGSAPFSGRFRPEGSLSAFDGEDLNGTWTLEVYDVAAQDTGTLNSWSLEIASGETTTQTDASGAYVFANLANGTYNIRHQIPTGWRDTNPASGVQQVNYQGGTVENVDFLSAPLPAHTALGAVDYRTLTGLNPSAGTCWYSLEATHQGYLTLESLFTGSTNSVALSLYDSSLNLLATSTPSTGGERIDWQTVADRTYYISLSGTLTDVDLRLTNLVAHNGSTVTIAGTSGADQLEFAAAAWHQVTINGALYQFDSSVVTTLTFDGGSGADTAVLSTSTGNDQATLGPGTATLQGSGYQIQLNHVPDLILINAGGTDTASLYGSSGNDTLEGTPAYAQLAGQGFFSRVEGFRYVYAYGQGGTDTALLNGSTGDDTFDGRSGYSVLSGAAFSLRAEAFARVTASGTGSGVDVAYLYDSAGNDTLATTGRYARLTGSGFSNTACYFDSVYAYSTAGGVDTANMADSQGDDAFTASPTEASFQVGSCIAYAMQFERVTATSTAGGTDTAEFFDSAGNDRFMASPIRASLTGEGFTITAVRFETVTAHATVGGTDVADLYDSSGDDTFESSLTVATLSGRRYLNRVESFELVHCYASDGTDVAHLSGSTGNDTVTVNGQANVVRLSADGFSSRVRAFDDVTVSAGTGGTDRCYFYDSTGNDAASAAGSDLILQYAAATAHIEAFTWARLYSTLGGQDTKHIGTIDFLLETVGSWQDA